GIFLNAAGGNIDGLELIGMRCINNGANGLEAAGPIKHLQINGGDFGGNSTSTANTYLGMLLANTVQDCIIRGATVGPCFGSTDQQLAGIGVGTGIPGLIVENCDLTTAGAGMQFGGNPGAGCRIADNKGWRTSSQ